jgi:hypothetical protein
MLRRMVHFGTGGSEECIASIIKVTRIGELGTTLAVNWQPKHAVKKYYSQNKNKLHGP